MDKIIDTSYVFVCYIYTCAFWGGRGGLRNNLPPASQKNMVFRLEHEAIICFKNQF